MILFFQINNDLISIVTEIMEQCEKGSGSRGYYITVLCVAQSDWWFTHLGQYSFCLVVHREEQEEWENHTFGASLFDHFSLSSTVVSTLAILVAGVSLTF